MHATSLQWNGDVLGEQLFPHPVAHQGSVSVGHVVADVIALLVHDQRGVGCFFGNPYRLMPGDEPIELAKDNQEGLSELVQDAFQRDLLGDFLCFGLIL